MIEYDLVATIAEQEIQAGRFSNFVANFTYLGFSLALAGHTGRPGQQIRKVSDKAIQVHVSSNSNQRHGAKVSGS